MLSIQSVIPEMTGCRTYTVELIVTASVRQLDNNKWNTVASLTMSINAAFVQMKDSEGSITILMLLA